MHSLPALSRCRGCTHNLPTCAPEDGDVRTDCVDLGTLGAPIRHHASLGCFCRRSVAASASASTCSSTCPTRRCRSSAWSSTRCTCHEPSGLLCGREEGFPERHGLLVNRLGHCRRAACFSFHKLVRRFAGFIRGSTQSHNLLPRSSKRRRRSSRRQGGRSTRCGTASSARIGGWGGAWVWWWSCCARRSSCGRQSSTAQWTKVGSFAPLGQTHGMESVSAWSDDCRVLRVERVQANGALIGRLRSCFRQRTAATVLAAFTTTAWLRCCRCRVGGSDTCRWCDGSARRDGRRGRLDVQHDHTALWDSFSRPRVLQQRSVVQQDGGVRCWPANRLQCRFHISAACVVPNVDVQNTATL